MVACIAYKLMTTLDNCLQNLRDKDRPEDRQGTVCKLLQLSQATYIGETIRNLSNRLTEHAQSTRNGEHHLQMKHQIGWDSTTCVTYCVY